MVSISHSLTLDIPAGELLREMLFYGISAIALIHLRKRTTGGHEGLCIAGQTRSVPRPGMTGLKNSREDHPLDLIPDHHLTVNPLFKPSINCYSNNNSNLFFRLISSFINNFVALNLMSIDLNFSTKWLKSEELS